MDAEVGFCNKFSVEGHAELRRKPVYKSFANKAEKITQLAPSKEYNLFLFRPVTFWGHGYIDGVSILHTHGKERLKNKQTV